MPEPVPEVLFVCVHNAGRSQMAAALLDRHAHGRVIVRSAGTAPADTINPAVVDVMREVGIDLAAAGAVPKSLTDAAVRASDVVVTMGCGDTCPYYPGIRYVDWALDDPAGRTPAEIRPIRDEIERRVLDLLDELIDERRSRMTTDLNSLSLAQLNLVKTSTGRLKDEFAGIFAAETIERFIADSLDQLLGTAKITTWVPILVERFTRDRLKALAKVEGKLTTTVPSVLFLCVHNAGRSQMAAAWLKRLAGDRVIVYSGGSMPESEVNPAAIDAMAEIGIDIRSEFPKPWTDEIVRAADVVITMGCGDACPIFPGKKYEDWEVPDPAGVDVTAVRAIRDDIGQRVRHLIDELELTS